jgi:hypothetical protein
LLLNPTKSHVILQSWPHFITDERALFIVERQLLDILVFVSQESDFTQPENSDSQVSSIR